MQSYWWESVLLDNSSSLSGYRVSFCFYILHMILQNKKRINGIIYLYKAVLVAKLHSGFGKTTPSHILPIIKLLSWKE